MARVVTFKADPSLLEASDKFAREKRVARSVVIRDALVAFLKARGIRVVDVEVCMAVQRAASEYVGWVRTKLPYLSPTLMSVLGCVGRHGPGDPPRSALHFFSFSLKLWK